MSKDKKNFKFFDEDEFDPHSYKNNKKKDKRQMRRDAEAQTKFINQMTEVQLNDEESKNEQNN